MSAWLTSKPALLLRKPKPLTIPLAARLLRALATNSQPNQSSSKTNSAWAKMLRARGSRQSARRGGRAALSSSIAAIGPLKTHHRMIAHKGQGVDGEGRGRGICRMVKNPDSGKPELKPDTRLVT